MVDKIYNQFKSKLVRWIGMTTFYPLMEAVMSLYPDVVTNYLNDWNYIY